MVAELIPLDETAVDDVGVDVDKVIVAVELTLGLSGDNGSESDIGEDGGDVLISSGGVDLPDSVLFGAPFNAELLANCKYADSLGKISLTSSISLLMMKRRKTNEEIDRGGFNLIDNLNIIF